MSAKEEQMVLEVDNFTLQMVYDKEKDTLEMSTDRALKNSDILLILIQVLDTVEAEHRTDVLDLALATLQQRAHEKAN